MTKQGIKDNAQHLAGLLIGWTYLKATGKRYGKEARGTRWFSTVSANLAANGAPFNLFPFR